jgi:hypothetical protein
MSFEQMQLFEDVQNFPYDFKDIESRPDVVKFTSPPLEQDLTIAGDVMLVLYASADLRDSATPRTRCTTCSDRTSRTRRCRNHERHRQLLVPELEHGAERGDGDGDGDREDGNPPQRGPREPYRAARDDVVIRS